MPTLPGDEPRDGSDAFSLVRGDRPFRIQRALGLIPPGGGLGVGRRALLLALLTWGPVAAWAYLTGRALPGRVAEPLFEHFGVHVRCLLAIPLLIVAEATVHAMSTELVPYFVSSGLVPANERARFAEAVRRARNLRDRSLPWALIAGLVIGWIVARPITSGLHELEWAVEGTQDKIRLGFGALWFFYVARPIFVALLLAWLWRILLLGLLLRRIAALDLSIVPSHPDRAGGLGFLEHLPLALGPVVLAVSAVLASHWAHDVTYHSVDISSLKMPAATFLAGIVVLVLAPLSAFSGPLRRARRQGLLDYGTLVGEHGRRVRRRWILREPVEDSEQLLAAPELGPVADTLTLYESVARMRTAPVGRMALAGVLVPAVLPMLVVAAIRVPLKDLLLPIVKTLL